MPETFIDKDNGFLCYKVDKTDLLLMEENYEKDYSESSVLNSRTEYDNPESRKAGILGEIVFHRIYPDAQWSKEKINGVCQYDFEHNNTLIDIKTKLRKDKPRKFFEASVFEYQSHFTQVHEYIFMSTIHSYKNVWICGNILKKDFMKSNGLVKWFEGEIDASNGMEFKQDTYCLTYDFLNKFGEFH